MSTAMTPTIDANHGDEGNQRDEGLLPLRQEVAEGDEELERADRCHATSLCRIKRETG